eukprot:TRINITY_DN56775_c0_g1_i1.p1 TRINITY_DN56775_c0_g1~~TRINITY_DN56775_c0_g1_i1.p1  ORF type:complete len:150 (+),score=43.09 TRINITY_DN56775_c0_g1_i1:69-518(+)
MSALRLGCRALGRMSLRAPQLRGSAWPVTLPRVIHFQDLASRSFCAPSASPADAESFKRRKRMLWRAKSRGWLELDVLMGTFVEKHVWDFDESKLDLLEEVLELENPDLFKWFTGQASVPEEILKENEVMAMLMEYVKSDHSDGFNITR